MSRITLNDIENETTLSTEQQQSVRGGIWVRNMFGGWSWVQPAYNPYNPFAWGYGASRNQFNPGSFGFGVQAATFQSQALADQRHNTFLANF